MSLRSHATAGLALLVSLGASADQVPAQLPACALTSLAEGAPPAALKTRPGEVLYVDFWASWCGPCVKAFPFMNELAAEFSGRGLRVLAINLDEEAADARGFLERHPASFEIGADPSGECPRRFGVDAMPSSYLVDGSGRIHHRHRGFRGGDAAALREAIGALLEAEAAP